MPTLDRIAKTIVGPNEAHHVGPAKLIELQDLKWGRLKSQEQAHFLRAAKFVQALYDAEAGAQPPPLQPPPIPQHSVPVGVDRTTGAIVFKNAPTRVLDADQRSTEHLLMQFRSFVMRNVMTWLNGAGDNHHPIWLDVATELDMYDLNVDPKDGPDYAYIQPANRKPYTQLLAEFVDMHNEREATDRGG